MLASVSQLVQSTLAVAGARSSSLWLQVARASAQLPSHTSSIHSASAAILQPLAVRHTADWSPTLVVLPAAALHSTQASPAYVHLVSSLCCSSSTSAWHTSRQRSLHQGFLSVRNAVQAHHMRTISSSTCASQEVAAPPEAHASIKEAARVRPPRGPKLPPVPIPAEILGAGASSMSTSTGPSTTPNAGAVDPVGGTAAAAPPTSSTTSGSSGGGTFNYGPRKVTMLRRKADQSMLQGIVHIQNSLNNIIMTLTSMDGQIKTWSSPGTAGFKNARKRQPVAAERAADDLAKKALKLGYGSVVVKFKGMGNNKQYAVQSLHAAGLRITQLMDVTPIPYNGCRPRSKRRV